MIFVDWASPTKMSSALLPRHKVIMEYTEPRSILAFAGVITDTALAQTSHAIYA